MRYINGDGIQIGDIVCYISSTSNNIVRPCLAAGGTIIAIGTESVVIDDCGKAITRCFDQIYPM